MPIPTEPKTQDRINQQLEQVKRDLGDNIVNLLRDANRTHLDGKAIMAAAPTIDRNSVRWTLAWKENEVSFNLNVVVAVVDDGKQARVDRVWVHRHVTTPFDFDGHTPTTRMRRLTSLSIAEIKSAIEAEFR
jgi:hypothetical protein